MAEAFFDYLRSKLAFDEQQLSQLKPHLKTRHVEKGQQLLRVGEVCLYSSFVLEGCLRSYVIDAKGKEHIIQFAPENWWISEQISFFKKEPAIYYIDAIEATDFVALDSAFFEELNRVVPHMQQMLNDLQLNSLRSFQKRLISHLSETGEQRYLGFIKTYPSLSLRLPQWMIASFLGLTPESLSRIRKELQDK
ncbi:Crp/Fnr family transcriptional regulator [Pontibacter chitinilyticus]|uniref:Crp/Fnr family transcriptional regulator n=1 Tax=Pontibacter chitinilyticus TaxID=2674989 RepID=UPI00321BEDC7